MYSDDVTKKSMLPPQDAAAQRKVAQVYKDAEANTDPHREPNQQPVREGVVVTPETVDELTKAIYHLQQVVMRLRGGA